MPATLPAALQHSAFYRFVAMPHPTAAADAVRALAQAHGLLGSIVVAAEGISGAVAGAPEGVAAFEAALQRPQMLAGVLRGMVFKRSACITLPFGRLKVGVKPEVVALGLPEVATVGVEPTDAAPPPPAPPEGGRLAPRAWRERLARGDVVVLDNRNHFEYRLGHFRAAVDPRVNNFRDFAAYVLAEAPAWREAGRPVAMYCTGGIRCDKTAPWLRSLGLAVWQLDGGILNYFQQIGDTDRDWVGECFVFDKRIALDASLCETATTAEQVFDASQPGEAWRLRRAQRLAGR